MYFVKVTKNYKEGEPYDFKFGRTTPEPALKLYKQEIHIAEKVVDYIPVTSIVVELFHKKRRLEFVTIEPNMLIPLREEES